MGGIMRPTTALADMEATGADTGTGTTAIASTEVDATAEGMMPGAASALVQGLTAVEGPCGRRVAQQTTPRRRRRQLRPAGGQGTRPVGTRASTQGVAGAEPELEPEPPPAQPTTHTAAGEAQRQYPAGQQLLLGPDPPSQPTILTVAGEPHNTAGQLHLLVATCP